MRDFYVLESMHSVFHICIVYRVKNSLQHTEPGTCALSHVPTLQQVALEYIKWKNLCMFRPDRNLFKFEFSHHAQHCVCTLHVAEYEVLVSSAQFSFGC